ncbi:hypothetical protein [Escherichia coli]|uniref:hypothetical protein n=1 Tax=Escherichia coli TaxID=562 RepID=UPI0014181AB8|nr:hypothetical protein [Escherichia coli]MWF13628.1 hypothetical protein [Escherichia coli]
MTQLRKDKLEEIKYRAETQGINAGYQPEEILAMVNRLLAAEGQKPVRYLNKFTGVCVTLEQQPDAATDTAVYVPLFAAPQPVAMPDELLAAMEEVLRISDRDHEAWHRARDGIAACRAAMLNEPVSQPYKLPDGYVLVPVEPTPEMCQTQYIGVDVFTGVTPDPEYYSIGGSDAAKIYRAMLAAAPQEPTK